MRARWAALGLAPLLLGAAFVPISESDSQTPARAPRHDLTDLDAYPAKPPDARLRVLFIHHSCGGQLLAAPGPEAGAHCIYESHPNGGDLRAMLTREGFEVHEASYDSVVGEHTDLFDWLPKFRDRMEAVLTCAHQDETYQGGERNDVVMFKSCFPNNAFVGEARRPETLPAAS